MTPDLEQIAVQALLADTAVTGIVGDRVGTRTPRTFGEPWVRVTLIDDLPDPSSSALHLVRGMVQIDCYGGNGSGSQQDASSLARTCRTVLHRLAYEPQATGAVVSRVNPGGIRRLPDTDLEPDRERYILTVEIAAHA